MAKRSALAKWIIEKFSLWLKKEEPPAHGYLTDFDRISYELRPADVILIEGRRRVSRIIRRITFSPWTHAALYIGRLHDIADDELRQKIADACQCSHSQQLIIESELGQGTVIAPLEKYNQDHVRICRPSGLSRHDAQKVIAFTADHLGVKYSVRHVFDLLRFLFPWALFPRRWRSSLFEHNALKPTEEICSSLIAEAFTSVKFPILPFIKKDNKGIELIQRNPRLYVPSDFDYSPYFAIIKYPIFPLNEMTSYHNLPWVEGVMSNDYAVVPITTGINKSSL